jgi:predicted PurR-regulated permease PerM
MAAVVTGVFSPVYRIINIKDKINPPFSSLLTCVLIFLVLFVPTALFIGILTKEAYNLYTAAKDAALYDQLQNLIAGNIWIDKAKIILVKLNIKLSGEELNKILSELAKTVGLFLYEQARAIASNMFAFVINFFLMLLVVYFLLIDGQKLINFIFDLSPLPKEQNEALIQKFKDLSGAIIVGNGLGGLIQGIAGGIAFAFVGFQSPFLWGVIMAILAFLPFVGIGAVFIPAIIYLFLQSRIGAGIFIIIIYLILSVGVEYLFKTKLVGDKVKMHTLLVFFSVMGGLKVFGMLGIIYGPLVVTSFLTLTDIYRANYQQIVESSDGK